MGALWTTWIVAGAVALSYDGPHAETVWVVFGVIAAVCAIAIAALSRGDSR